MIALICILIAGILSSLVPLVFEAYDSIVSIVFQVDTMLGSYIQNITSTIYDVGISLIILKFLKKGFDIYILGSDGDPDMDPVLLVTNFVRAIAVAIGFKPIYDLFVNVLNEIITDITVSMNIYEEVADFSSIGITSGIACLIAFILFLVLYCKSFILGINMMIMNLGMPMACTGLLDNDKGMFKNYFLTYVKTFLTVLIQVVLSKLGLYVIVTSAGIGNIITGDFDMMNVFLGLACMFTALSSPKLLSEFLIPSSPGGNMMSKIYAVNMVRSVVKSFVK